MMAHIHQSTGAQGRMTGLSGHGAGSG